MSKKRNKGNVTLRSYEFLDFLELAGLKQSCEKESLRDIYYTRFRPICEAEERVTSGASFGAIFTVWVHHKAILKNPKKDMVKFNPNFKKRDVSNIQAEERGKRSSVSPAFVDFLS